MILNKGFPEENKADIHVTRVRNDNISKHLETEGIAVYGEKKIRKKPNQNNRTLLFLSSPCSSPGWESTLLAGARARSIPARPSPGSPSAPGKPCIANEGAKYLPLHSPVRHCLLLVYREPRNEAARPGRWEKLGAPQPNPAQLEEVRAGQRPLLLRRWQL